MIQTAYWYLHTDQCRYDHVRRRHARRDAPARASSPARRTADVLAQSARMGWMPSLPDVRPQPARPRRRGRGRRASRSASYVVDQLKSGELRLRRRGPGRAGELPARPDDLAGQPARLLGQGQRVLPQAPARHRLVAARRPRHRPRASARATWRWHDEAPEGKLDLLLTLDFRMTSTTLFSDVVLPAATWYEKHDLNTTDMHPFVHSFNPAIAPPWQTRTDWDAFQTIAEKFSELAADPPRRPHGRRRGAAAARHPRRDGQPARRGPRLEARASASRCPGVTMPKLVVVERDYAAVADEDDALGPLIDTLGTTTKGVHLRRSSSEVDYLRAQERRRPRRRGRRPARRCETRRPRRARRSSRCPAPPTATSPPRASRPSRSAPASSWPTSPPSTRASRSPSPTPRPRRCR